MIGEDIINLLSYSVKQCNNIILRAIDDEDKGHVINEDHLNAHEWEIRFLILGVSFDVGSKPMVMTI